MRPAVCMVVACVAVTPSFTKTVLSREVRSALATLHKLVEVRSVGNVMGLLSLGRRSPRRGDRRSVFNPGAFPGQPTAISALRAIWQRRWAGWATFGLRAWRSARNRLGPCRLFVMGQMYTATTSAGGWCSKNQHCFSMRSSCSSGVMEIVPSVPASHEAGAVCYMRVHSLCKPYCVRAQEQSETRQTEGALEPFRKAVG